MTDPTATPGASSVKPGADWQQQGEYGDIEYHTADGIAKITINRPEVRNAFRPQTLFELRDAFDVARDDDTIGVIILTGKGDLAFCSGGDQRIRGDDGYIGDDAVAAKGIGRLNVLDLQVQIRRTPKASSCDGCWACRRWWPRAPRHVRPFDRGRQRAFPADRAQRWARSTAGTARDCSQRKLGRSALVRSGSCVGSTTRTRRWSGD